MQTVTYELDLPTVYLHVYRDVGKDPQKMEKRAHLVLLLPVQHRIYAIHLARASWRPTIMRRVQQAFAGVGCCRGCHIKCVGLNVTVEVYLLHSKGAI
jgi:hypothetical protein